MTIKQQGGIFGRNPTFNDVEVDGTLTLEGGLSTNSALTVNAATSTIESTGGAQLYLSRDDTAVANNNLIGGLAFKANDSSASPDPQYCGMKAYAAGSGNNPVLEFYSGNGNYDARTPQLSINYLGNVTIANGNLIMGTSGNGIDFSATSGTGTSELFDDYEEGTWTPVLSDATSGGNTATLGSSTAHYVKVGSVVHLFLQVININNSGMTGANTLYIQGLPYTSVSSNNSAGSVVFDRVSVSGFDAVTPAIGPTRDYMTLATTTTGAADANLTVAAFNNTASDIQNLTISYRA